MKRIICLIGIFGVFVISLFGFQTTPTLPVYDEEYSVLRFKSMPYPLAARLKHIEGVVVIHVLYDKNGIVQQAIPISGHKLLLPDCIANSKLWKFNPRKSLSAVIVYRFKFSGLCDMPCTSQFSFYPPNFAVITMGDMVVNHAAEN